MHPEEHQIDLRAYLKVLSRRRWIMLATFLTVVVTTGVVTWQLTPMYRAQASVEVLPTSLSSTEASRMIETFIDPNRGLQTQVGLIRSDAVLQLAAKQLGLSSVSDLRSLSVELVPDTQIVTITVDHPRPEEAANWANAVANSYITFRRDRALETSLAVSEEITKDMNALRTRIAELDTQLADNPTAKPERERAAARLSALEGQLQLLPDAEAVRRGGGTIISPAQPNPVPIRPKKALNLALAAVVGTMLALGIAFLAENLDDRMKSPEELEQRVGAPILGYIPLVKDWGDNPKPTLAMESESGSGAEEAYRTLMTNLRFVSLERPIRSLLVTSPVADVGKSTTAANLAATVAQSGEKVVLISADLRRPSAHRFFGLTNSLGLLQALDRRFPLKDALQEDQIPSLRFLAAGGLPPNPTQILDSLRFGEILTDLEKLSDMLILDSPPVLGLGDASALAAQVDGILFVVRAGSVTNREVSHAADQLRKAGGNIIGCVLNAVDATEGYGYYYRYYYSHYANDDGRSSKSSEKYGRNSKKSE